MQKPHSLPFLIAPTRKGSMTSPSGGFPAGGSESGSRPRTFSGFSLVEVVLALGITSFSLLTILGLLPVGLNVLQEAGEASTRARIVQKLHGEILLMPFAKVEDQFAGRTLYFDETGERVEETDTASVALYKVETQLTSPRYPNSGQVGADINDSLKAVELQFTKLRGNGNAVQSVIWVPNSGG
jgi:uncharacterized protein (TIGR02598 family)